MNELKDQVQEFLSRRSPTVKSWEEIFSQSGVPGPTYRIFINSLEAFAREQRIKGMEAALIWCIHFEKAYRENSFELPSTRDVWELKLHSVLKVKKQIDAEIQRMREEGSHVHSG